MELQKLLPILGFTLVLFAIDFYAFQAVKGLIVTDGPNRKALFIGYWSLSLLLVLMLVYFRIVGQAQINRFVLLFAFSTFFIFYFSKIIVCLFLLVEDIGRGGFALFHFVKETITGNKEVYSPARSAVLSKIAFSVAALPFFSLIYGMVKGAHKYQIRRVSIPIKNLPTSFEGLKIIHISDIHSGSFYDKEAVLKGINMVMDEKPDLVFFTGDLVNNEASEIVDYMDVFSKIKAPLGVFSVLGNHDYGDYIPWSSPEAKVKNLKTLMQHHAEMGWKLLMDEHAVISRNGESITILGIQNWGAKGRFPKYGDLAKAVLGTENHKVKLLLSHDPSHWDAQVLKDFPDIDAMFSGHTHGMQFGIDIPGVKWSPIQYMYKQWAGLYSEGHQHLHVNRGFGFLGYPGRVGIWPEISVISLEGAGTKA